MKSILVTGGAGFIGSNLIDKLLMYGYHKVTCIDNLVDTPIYGRDIKLGNIAQHTGNSNFRFIEADICDSKLSELVVDKYDAIVHLAARAGVRDSLINPMDYQTTNVVGLQNMLEIARKNRVKQFIFASSSSVYGINPKYPWSEKDEAMPISPYAASKISGEWLGKTYSNLYGLRFIGLRFFTVYGNRQRPDLLFNKIKNCINNDVPIDLYGNGNTLRDYTHVDDIVSGIIDSLLYDKSDFEIFNLGNGVPYKLDEVVNIIETIMDKKAIIRRLGDQPGDVRVTWANIYKAKNILGYEPKIKLKDGLKMFLND